MGMNAEILVLGEFSEDVKNCLDYPSDYYDNIEEGSSVVTTVCHMCTSSSSEILAQCFGIDPWDFSQHVFTPKEIDFESLTEVLLSVGDNPDEVIRDIKMFIKKKFLFIYRPNG